MNSLFQINRELRDIRDPAISENEWQIKKIMVSHGYSREDAEKILAYRNVEDVKNFFGIGVGAFAAYKFNPIQKDLAKRHALFRKAWMRWPLQAAVFSAAYLTSVQIPNRVFKVIGNRTVTQEMAMSSTDLVGRFRLFEEGAPVVSAEQNLVNYLHEYSDRPFVKDELLARLEDLQKKGLKMRIRRMGKDLDDLYWTFGKIHGLENIAFAEEADLKATNGDPIALQLLVNRLEGGKAFESSFEELQIKNDAKLAAYKDQVGNLNLVTSDRKKILSLPLYMSKRVQTPEPKRGQSQYELFANITGKTYNSDLFIDLDKQTKITEFDFEKYLNPALLQRVNSQNDTFKNFVRNVNFFTNTTYEQLQDDKTTYVKSTPILAHLTPREQRELLHLLSNGRGRSSEGQEEFEDIYTYLIETCPQIEEKLAQVSEEENFNLKNRYRHQWKTMNFADKKRMPIHESKVADLLRNSHIYRAKIVKEIGTYQKELDKGDQFENGVLTYLNEAAWGEMRELINDVGIRDETIEFTNLAKLNKMKEQNQFASDMQMRYLQNSLYTPLDMTDYEDQFVSWRELPGALPIAHSEKLLDFKDEDWPQINALVEHFIPEKPPLQSTGPTITAIMEAERAEVEPEEDDEEEEEEGEYGEEYGEEGGEEYGEEYGEEEEGPPSNEREWPPKDIIKTADRDNRVFRVHEKLRSKFNETEIDNFMKLLALKPHTQWEDTSFFHHKLGVRSYEDGHQEHDPDFHMFAEVERKHAEFITTRRWRKGTEVRFVVGDKQPEWTRKNY